MTGASQGLHGEAVNADLHAGFIAESPLLGPEGRAALARRALRSEASDGAVILDQSSSMRDMLQQARLG